MKTLLTKYNQANADYLAAHAVYINQNFRENQIERSNAYRQLESLFQKAKQARELVIEAQ